MGLINILLSIVLNIKQLLKLSRVAVIVMRVLFTRLPKSIMRCSLIGSMRGYGLLSTTVRCEQFSVENGRRLIRL